MLEKLKKSKFVRSLLSIAIPLALQNLIATSLNMADTVMVSTLGDASIAAVGLVNQYTYFYFVTVFGICSGAAIFLAQYYGKGDQENLNRSFLVMISVVFSFAAVFTILTFAFREPLLRLLSPDSDVRSQGRIYLRIISYTMIITGVSFALGTALRSTGDAKTPMKISAIAFLTNVICNFVLIFGKLGFPSMGVAGAALGTLIARCLEALLLLLVIGRYNKILKLEVRMLRKLRQSDFSRYFEVALPVILAETFWSFGQLLFSVAYARISKEAAAAIQLTNTINNAFFITAHSISDAAAVIIGQTIGSGDHELTKKYSISFIKMTSVIGFLSGLVLVFAPGTIMLIFKGIDQNLIDISKKLLIIRGLVIPFRFLNGLLIVGILRGGGDSKYALYLELFTMWAYAVPLSFIGAVAMGWRVETVFAVVSLEEIIKLIFIYPRYHSGKWITDVTLNT